MLCCITHRAPSPEKRLQGFIEELRSQISRLKTVELINVLADAADMTPATVYVGTV